MNKLILLDGTQGGGKSTVAHCVCTISNGKYVCVDPDEYFNSNAVYFFFNGDTQSQIIKIFLKYFKRRFGNKSKTKT